MRYIKNFSLFEDKIKLDPYTRDIFGIWTEFSISWPVYIDAQSSYFTFYPDELIDEPDPHVKVYSSEYEDDDGVIWGVDMSVIDGHYEDIEWETLDISGGNEYFIELIKKSFEDKGFKFSYEDVSYEWIVKTDATWHEICSIYPKVFDKSDIKNPRFSINGNKVEPLYVVRFDFKEKGTENKCSYFNLKMDENENIFTS